MGTAITQIECRELNATVFADSLALSHLHHLQAIKKKATQTFAGITPSSIVSAAGWVSFIWTTSLFRRESSNSLR